MPATRVNGRQRHGEPAIGAPDPTPRPAGCSGTRRRSLVESGLALGGRRASPPGVRAGPLGSFRSGSRCRRGLPPRALPSARSKSRERSAVDTRRCQPGDEARAAAEKDVAVDPGQQHRHPVAEPDEHGDVQGHPGKPGQQAAEVQPPDFDNGAGLTDSGNGAQIFVMEAGGTQLTGRPDAPDRNSASITFAT